MKRLLGDSGAETAVLAGLFAYGLESYVEISDIIDHASFSSQNNQLIYRCIEKILSKEASVDLPSLLSAADQLGFSETIQTKQELQYIKSLMDFPVNKDNVIHFAAQVKKFEFARKIRSLANKIGRDIEDIKGDEEIDEIIGIVENPI